MRNVFIDEEMNLDMPFVVVPAKEQLVQVVYIHAVDCVRIAVAVG